MKISEMLLREDFYTILPKTLNKYASFLGIAREGVVLKEKGHTADLYVNEKINAIISAKPSRSVRDYLRTEYSVGGSSVRKAMVNAYLLAGMTLVKPLSQKGISLKSSMPLDDLLIYPCNKKIRLFDFASDIVYTVLKSGFPDTYIKRETSFRLASNIPFVPKIKSVEDGCYSERIIKGRPLARIHDSDFVIKKKKESVELIRSLTERSECLSALEYIGLLRDRCLSMLKAKEEFKNVETINAIFEKLLDRIQDCAISLVISHGDLQPGNIWIDSNGEVIIIDWETVKKRSPYYDYAALYCQLRNHGGLHFFCDRVKTNPFLSTIKGLPIGALLRILLAEELDYQTEEYLSLPIGMGMANYIRVINEFNGLEL